MKSDEVLIRTLTPGDLPLLGAFRCSAGAPWEDVVEAQIRPLTLIPKGDV